jgi:hypothetical protein
MSTPIPDPELDAQLDVALDDPEAASTSDTFQVTNLEQASWAVRKIAQHRAQLQEANEVYVAERERLDAYMRDAEGRCTKATEFLEGLLRRFHEERLAGEGAHPAIATKEQWAKAKSKTIRLPAGQLVARRGTDRLDVDDERFVEWARATGHDHLLHTTITPDKGEIKQAVGDVMEDGRVVDADSGEFMPGVTWVDGAVRFSVKTEEQGR